MKLREIAGNYNTDKFTRHCYLDIYAPLFDPIQDTVKNVLEIGVYYGDSISLWRDYFFNANVYGIDINDPPYEPMSRTFFLKGDAYNLEFIQRQGLNNKRFDIMIDDGPHTLTSMQFFASNYSQLLTSGGILVIEDIQYPEWIPSIISSFPSALTPEVIDHRTGTVPDDIVIVVGGG
jgi:hypothetical protein